MHDDHPPPRHTARPETDREFETPQSVRELRPDDQPEPVETQPTGSSPAPAHDGAPRPEARIRTTDAEPTFEMHTTFQRRWEQVQTMFVAGGNRGRARRLGMH